MLISKIQASVRDDGMRPTLAVLDADLKRTLQIVAGGRCFDQRHHSVLVAEVQMPIRTDNGRRPGVPSSESAELRAAKRRIRELETELLIVRQAAKFLDEERPRPKGSSR